MGKGIVWAGVLSLAASVAILAVFNTINWNDYKPELAAFASDALQMPVTIDGSVDVELFPAPRFIAE